MSQSSYFCFVTEYNKIDYKTIVTSKYSGHEMKINERHEDLLSYYTIPVIAQNKFYITEYDNGNIRRK